MLGFLIGVFMRTKIMKAIMLFLAIPTVISYTGFKITRWTYRQLRNGCIMIIGGTLLLVFGAHLLLSPIQAASTFALILLLHGVWFSRKGELFVVWWRAQWRYWTKYRWEFNKALRGANLVSMDPKHPGVKARIESVTANEFVDLVEVRMSTHQTPELYQQEIDGIRRTLGAVGGRAVNSRRGVQNVTLWLWKTDPLNQIVQPYEHRRPPEDGDWVAWFKEGLKIARYENGDPFALDLITVPFHWLLAGASRSGKSGAIGALIGQLEWAIKSGVVQIDAIDPAMGMELDGYDQAGLFHRFVAAELPDDLKGKSLEKLQEEYGDKWMTLLGDDFTQEVAIALRKFRVELQHRSTDLRRQGKRTFTPSKLTPLRILLVDEIATVMALGTVEVSMGGVLAKINIKFEMEEILRQLLKAGGMVVGAVQDPLKSQVDVRDLFTYFTCFGGVNQVGFDKLFGNGAYKAAGQPKIPKRLQGVAMTGTSILSLQEIQHLADEFDETIRVRLSWEDDGAVAAMRTPEPGPEPSNDPTTSPAIPAKEPVPV